MKATLTQKLQALREEFGHGLNGRFKEIEESWLRHRTGEAGIEPFMRGAHSLSGSGATYGFPEVSARAKVLEGLLCAGPHLLDRVGIERAMVALRVACTDAGPAAVEEGVPPVGARCGARNRRVLLIAVPDEACFVLEDQLTSLGYETASRAPAAPGAGSEPPFAVIAPLATPQGALIDEGAFLAIGAALPPGTPVILASRRSDAAARLHAAHLGAAGFIALPISIDSLTRILDPIAPGPDGPPFRIVVVDDDEMLARTYAIILEQAGMRVETASDPAAALALMEASRPDLVLVDLYMVEHSGLDLARAIRHHDAYLDIPIVFLSAETRLSEQLGALGLGADDFLTKPINATHLASAVRCRAARARQLRALVTKDGLTGLLHRGSLGEQLDAQVARASRETCPLAFAMIDVDHFKAVNDTYGHTAGDGVLVSLARLLKARLRQSDVVGRYGGEEFGVIMPGTGPVAAALVMEEIRSAFAGIKHRAGEVEFVVTLSAGVSSCPERTTATELVNAADEALYEAKRAGRNRVARGGGKSSGVILVVDDDDAITSFAETVLRHAGYEVVVTHDGGRALNLVRRIRPDVILSDLLLPRLHGFDLCRTIKEDPATRHVAVILMTAVYRMYRYRVEGKGRGADAFLEKPLVPATLLACIAAHVATPSRARAQVA